MTPWLMQQRRPRYVNALTVGADSVVVTQCSSESVCLLAQSICYSHTNNRCKMRSFCSWAIGNRGL